MTIREEIVKYLGDNHRKSIKEIAKAIDIGEAKVRTTIFREGYGLMAKGIVAKVSHEERKGFFSLAKNHTDNKKLFEELQENHTKLKRIVRDLIDDKNISENDYAYISRDN